VGISILVAVGCSVGVVEAIAEVFEIGVVPQPALKSPNKKQTITWVLPIFVASSHDFYYFDANH
jgi:hypothetical protein